MREAVTALIDYAKGELRLKTIEAQTHPDNQPSRNLLERLGFELTGTAGNGDADLLVYILEAEKTDAYAP